MTCGQVTRPDKVLYPDAGYTKADVAAHYERVASVMLPHLADRPLVLRRFPDGLDGQGFYQKEVSAHFPEWIRTVTVRSGNERGEVRHVVADAPEALCYLADQACLGLHRWLARSPALEYPDLLVIDLDPPEQVDPAELRRLARDTRDLLDTLGLVPFLQATGGTGYHVVAPLDGVDDVDEVRALARGIAEYLVAADPQRRTTEQRRARRGDRIFLDVQRNAYAQTAIAPYSLRARTGGPVATPLDWSELDQVAPDGTDLRSIGHRLEQRPDPWQDIHDHARPADEARRRLAELERRKGS